VEGDGDAIGARGASPGPGGHPGRAAPVPLPTLMSSPAPAPDPTPPADRPGALGPVPPGPSHRGEVASAFEVLAEGLAPFVDDQMHVAFPDEDWILMAAAKLGKRRDVLVSLTDPHFQLEVISRWWGPAFSGALAEPVRDTVTQLRTARNHWAHPDPDHPFDLDRALEVHHDAEDLLRAVGSPLADRLGEMSEDLRWTAVRGQARERGVSEAQALLEQLDQLQREQDELQGQLADARAAATSAAGRGRAVARQLAELQAQYAAVAGLRDDYLDLRRQLDAERSQREEVLGDTTQVREQLAATEAAAEALEAQSAQLREELEAARASMDAIDPLETEVGRRWLWLVTALVLVLGLLVGLVAYVPR
jgi:hypothetical protein